MKVETISLHKLIAEYKKTDHYVNDLHIEQNYDERAKAKYMQHEHFRVYQSSEIFYDMLCANVIKMIQIKAIIMMFVANRKFCNNGISGKQRPTNTNKEHWVFK